MITLKRYAIILLAIITCLVGFELGEQLAIPGAESFVSTAEAVVGRPLTPVSVAGVARRTTRRTVARVDYRY
jgi:nucleoside permease NupC